MKRHTLGAAGGNRVVAACHNYKATLTGGDIAVNVKSFERHLKAESLSAPYPVLRPSLPASSPPSWQSRACRGKWRAFAAKYVDSFSSCLLEQWKPATANNRFRRLHSLFRGVLEERLIRVPGKGQRERVLAIGHKQQRGYWEEVLEDAPEATTFHIEALHESGQPAPEDSVVVTILPASSGLPA